MIVFKPMGTFSYLEVGRLVGIGGRWGKYKDMSLVSGWGCLNFKSPKMKVLVRHFFFFFNENRESLKSQLQH